MKPARGPANSWLSSLPRERRTALIALAILVALFASLVAYQRLVASVRSPIGEPETRPTADASQPATQAEPDVGKAVSATPDVAGAKPNAAPARPPQIMWPLAGERKVLTSYGFAYSEAYGDFRLHPGVDYAAGLGEAVMAAAAGKVVSVEDDPADGKVVTMDHGNGLMTRYAGLGQVLVGANAAVQPGNILGQVGQPGPAKASIGTHLHFEVLINGEPVDPDTFLSK